MLLLRGVRPSLCPALAAWCLTVSLAFSSPRRSLKLSAVISTNSKAGPSFRRLRLVFLLVWDIIGRGAAIEGKSDLRQGCSVRPIYARDTSAVPPLGIVLATPQGEPVICLEYHVQVNTRVTQAAVRLYKCMGEQHLREGCAIKSIHMRCLCAACFGVGVGYTMEAAWRQFISPKYNPIESLLLEEVGCIGAFWLSWQQQAVYL